MKKIDNFTNIYKVSKTLKFKLIPVGKTEENFNKAKILEIDEKRAENYKKAKLIIDKYFTYFIEKNLNEIKSKEFNKLVKRFDELYYKKDKTDKEKDELSNIITKKLRNEIVECFKTDKVYSILFKGKELLEAILNDENLTEEEYIIIFSFNKFSTYFSNFLTNRSNMFSSEEKVGSIAYRCINENLPIFLNNLKIFEKVKKVLVKELIELNSNIQDLSYGCKIDDVFTSDYYSICLSGRDISKYNAIIGGKALENGEKIKGLNEYINLYNQQIAIFNKEHKDDKKQKLPQLKQLYKQILQEGEKISFSIESLEKDEEVYNYINEYLGNSDYKFIDIIKNINKVFKNLKEYDLNRIYINNKYIADVSQRIYGNWNLLKVCFEKEYDENHASEKTKKNYDANKKKYFDNLKHYSISKIIELVNKYYHDLNIDFVDELNDNFEILSNNFNASQKKYSEIEKNKAKIKSNEKNIEIIKNLLDSVKDVYDFINIFKIDAMDADLNEYFYSDIDDCKKLVGIIHLYNIVRNYITKKPYSLDKIKLNFESPIFLRGWDSNFDTKSSLILRKEYKYYLAIINSKLDEEELKEIYKETNNTIDKLNYIFQKPDFKNIPRLFIRSKGDNYAPAVKKFNLPVEDIIDIYDNKYYTTVYQKKDKEKFKESLIKLIDYYKLGFSKHESYSMFKFKWKESQAYNSIDEFQNDCIVSCYELAFEKINFDTIRKYIDEGKIYLYQIYNKDFSDNSHGNKNLHTLYFEQLFDKENLKNVVYKLNGEAEVFYRKKSIEYKITHPKNVELKNKNVLNDKKTSKFPYDLVKDKRFAFDQMELHIPITINFKSEGNLYNDKINESIKNCKKNYIIGIDRGERNLIYVVVINENGEIIEQISLNEIVNNCYKTDYRDLLDKKEEERDKARKNWTTIENIKELKEGYISQVVHKICELVEKYDAIIVLEDLNLGFKRSRIKVEKQVYQKFEKMLIDKLNLYINKNSKPDECGGLRKAYQLTRPYEGNNKMSFQNGIIYYIAPWNTSKIDPTTGFVNLFRFGNYNSFNERKSFIESMDDIRYNEENDYFEFEFNYDNYENCSIDYKKKWIICTSGDRIKTFRNEKTNNQWDTEIIKLTSEYKKLFKNYNVDIKSKLKKQVVDIDDKKFFDDLFYLLKLTMQMRNSEPNTDVDYLISPIKNKKGDFYNSEICKKNNEKLPYDADANGAYNIARKGLMIVKRIKEGQKEKLTVISNAEWLKFAQENV